MSKYTLEQLEKMVDDKIDSLNNEWVSIGELAHHIFEYTVENSHNTALIVRLYEGLKMADISRKLIEAYKYAAFMCVAVEIKKSKGQFAATKDKDRWKLIRDKKWIGNMKVLEAKGLVAFKEDKKGSKGGSKNSKVKDSVDVTTDEISDLIHEGVKIDKEDEELKKLITELEAIKDKIKLRVDAIRVAEEKLLDELRRKNKPKAVETESKEEEKEAEAPTLDSVA